MTAHRTLTDMVSSKARTRLPFKGERLLDAMNFGFSYIESEDHIVEFVAANPRMTKRIMAEIDDSVLDPEDGGYIGRLWTARLLVSRKLGDNQLLFSNNTFSAVVDVNLNPNPDEEL